MRQADIEEELQRAFRIFDKDGDGFITVQELRFMMTNLGEKYKEEDEMIQVADIDKKGKVDFQGIYLYSSLIDIKQRDCDIHFPSLLSEHKKLHVVL